MRNPDVTTLLAYNYWANRQVLAASARVPAEQFAAPATATRRGLRETLVHTLDVEWSWRLRLQRLPEAEWASDLAETDYPDAGALAAHWERDEAEMLAWLAGLSDDDLAAPVDHGPKESFPLWYYLVHIVTHGNQQRADAATLLTAYGQSPGDLDFLNYADTTRGS